MRRRPVLLLDEPFAALGPALRHETLELLGRLRNDRGLAVLMVSHHPDDARHIAERTAFVHGGRILELAETVRVLGAFRSPELRAYLGVRIGEQAKQREHATPSRTPRGGTGYGGADFADIGRELTLKTGHREAMSYTTWHGVLYDHS